MLRENKLKVSIKLTEKDLSSIIDEFTKITELLEDLNSKTTAQNKINFTNLEELLTLFKSRQTYSTEKVKKKNPIIIKKELPDKGFEYVPTDEDLNIYSIPNRKKAKYSVDFLYAKASSKFVAIAEHNRNEAVSKATKEEKIFKSVLKTLNVKYEYQHIIFVDDWHFYIADFYLPDYNIVIEVDGNFHNIHGHSIKDRERTKLLMSNAKVRDVVRISNKDVTNTQGFVNKVSKVLNGIGLIKFNYNK